MDFGDIRSISFTTYDEEKYLDDQDFEELHSYVRMTHMKLQVGSCSQAVLKHRLRKAEAMYDVAGSRGISRLTALRVANLRTTLHTLYRYELLLVRDLMRVQARLGDPPSHETWNLWYRNEDFLSRHSPNVHDMFLWQVDLQHDDSTDSDSIDASFSEGNSELWRTVD